MLIIIHCTSSKGYTPLDFKPFSQIKRCSKKINSIIIK